MTTTTPNLLSMTQVCKLTTLSRTIINKRRIAGTFPAAVSIGEKRIAFVEAEVRAWILERMNSRKAA